MWLALGLGLAVLAKQGSACGDVNVNCTIWSAYCVNTTESWPAHYSYMQVFCKGTCELCPETQLAGRQGSEIVADTTTDEPEYRATEVVGGHGKGEKGHEAAHRARPGKAAKVGKMTSTNPMHSMTATSTSAGSYIVGIAGVAATAAVGMFGVKKYRSNTGKAANDEDREVFISNGGAVLL